MSPAGGDASGAVGAEDKVEQPGEARVELLGAQSVDPLGPLVTLFDQPGAAQDREVVAGRGLAYWYVEAATATREAV